jgi:hypothetical protein
MSFSPPPWSSNYEGAIPTFSLCPPTSPAAILPSSFESAISTLSLCPPPPPATGPRTKYMSVKGTREVLLRDHTLGSNCAPYPNYPISLHTPPRFFSQKGQPWDPALTAPANPERQLPLPHRTPLARNNFERDLIRRLEHPRQNVQRELEYDSQLRSRCYDYSTLTIEGQRTFRRDSNLPHEKCFNFSF